LGKYEDCLKAGEAALVLNISAGDDQGKAQTLLGIAKAHAFHGHREKALKVGVMASELFRTLNMSGAFQQAALDVVVQSQLLLGKTDEALKSATSGVSSLEKAGEKAAALAAMRTLVNVYLAREEIQDALGASERAVEVSRELGDSAAQAAALDELARLRAAMGYLSDARLSADEALPLAREAGDAALEGRIMATIGASEDALAAPAVAFGSSEATAEEYAALELVRDAVEQKSVGDLQNAIAQCTKNWRIKGDMVEEILRPVIAADPHGAGAFWLAHRPDEIFAGDGADYQGVQLERIGTYFHFRQTMMGYGPGFRLMSATWRKGTSVGPNTGCCTVDLKEDHDEWEEYSKYHPGMLDCALQVGLARASGVPHSEDRQ